MYKLVSGCVERGLKRVRLHLLTDGRDVPDGSSVKFFGEVQEFLKGLSGKGVDAAIASGGGRMKVTMDRYEVPAPLSCTAVTCIVGREMGVA